MKLKLKNAAVTVFITAVIGRLLVPFAVLAQCNLLMRPEIFDLFNYVR